MKEHQHAAEGGDYPRNATTQGNVIIVTGEVTGQVAGEVARLLVCRGD